MASVFENEPGEGKAHEMAEGPDMERREDAAEGEGGEQRESPEYLKARELMLSKLYEEGAAEGIANAMASAPDVVQGIVDQSMTLADVMEQATQGSVPDEEVMSFVIDIVQEVVDIAQGSGIQVSNGQIASAVREVLAQVVENLGGDSTSIRQEMGQMDPEQVGAEAAKIGG